MSKSFERRILLRWGFLGIGYLLLFGHRFAVHRLLMADIWAGMLFGERSALYAFTMGGAYLFLIPSSLLCLATGWGLGRNMRWSRWTGVAVCVMFLAGFPILTALGIAGLYFLLTMPPLGAASQPGTESAIAKAASRSKDYWTAKSQSKLQPVIVGVFSLAAFNAIGWLGWWARGAGMPRRPWGLEFWL